MSGPARWLLPPGVLVPLARSCAVPVPASWASAPSPWEEALLSRLDVLPDGAALAPWRTPAVTLRLLVAPLGQRSSVPANGPAAAFEAHVTVGEDRLVALVRRDGVGLVELTTAPVEALGDELERVLQGLGGAPGDGTEVRVSRAAFAALCEGGGGPGADVLARATRVLETTLVTPDGAVTGGLWYDADGWWRVDVLGADVVLHPAASRARDWAPLLDQVLT